MIPKHKPYPKIKPVRDKRYLKWATLHEPCYICGSRWNGEQQVVYAHQTIPELKKISVKGTSQKEHDNWILPEHSIEHIEWEHGKGNKLDNRLTLVFELNKQYAFECNDGMWYEIMLMSDGGANMIEILEFITLNWHGY